MSSTRPPAVRVSARQSALHQQQLQQQQEQEQLRRQAQRERESTRASRSTNDYNLDQSSRSLSPALSDSPSMSGSDHPHQTNNTNESGTEPFSDPKLSSYWETALVYGFLIKFRTLLQQNCPLRELPIEDLETGLLATSTNTCIEDIHSNLLTNMLNRKKAVDSSSWHRVLLETLDVKQKTGEWEMDNPLRLYESYYSVPPRDRVLMLKALVEWVLQEGTSIRQGIEDYNEAYMVEPFGTDQQKRVYWYFGEGTLRVYRETNSKKKNAGWETVAKDLEELKSLVASFDKSTSKIEKTLQERLLTEIIEPAEEKILRRAKRQERDEKKMQRLAMFHQMAATRTTRTRSSNRLNQPKYTFDDEEDEDDEDQYAVYSGSSSRRKAQEESESTETGQSELAHGEEHNHQNQQGQVSGTSSSHDYSGRSSVDRDSDTSISVAFQKTKMVEDELNSLNRKANKDQDDDYVFEEDREDDNGSASSDQASSTVAEPVVQESSTLFEDIEMK
ncbi:MAG: hypothetical protein BYD32DRAFT_491864 [Podila humilis]|nr:MAG: hypothetical protein BYD32DRAFT_491864 [Podila humilis]